MTFCQHLICMLPKKWIISSFQNNKLALKCLTAPLTRQMMFFVVWWWKLIYFLTCPPSYLQWAPLPVLSHKITSPLFNQPNLFTSIFKIKLLNYPHHKQINFQKSQILNQFDTCVMLAEVFLNMHFSWMRCVHRRKDHWSWTKQCDQFFWIWDAHMWTLPWLPVSHLTSLQQSVKQQPRKTSNTF